MAVDLDGQLPCVPVTEGSKDGLHGLGCSEEEDGPEGGGQGAWKQSCDEVNSLVSGGEEGGVQRGAELMCPFL